DLHILDVGCGTGLYAKAMLDHGVGRMSLIDASQDMLNVASSKLATEVIPHLDSGNDRTFPNATCLLKEANRCLKKNGIVAITTILPENTTNYWYLNLHPEHTQRCYQVSSSLDEFETMFSKSGLQSIRKLTFLGPGIISYKNIINSNAYLDQSWVNAACVYELTTDKVMKAIHEKVHRIVQSGMWQQWMQENDSTEELGGVTLLVCQRGHKD
ncbi:hypothetical protein MAR_034468, partial [Mya arenaria]